MTSALDQKGLADVQREFSHVPPGLVEHIISAYLSTVTPPEIAGVVEALRELAKSCGWEYGTETGNTAWHAATLIERLAASQAETRRLALEEAAAHLKRQPSFGDGKWAAAHVRALIDRPSTEGGAE